MRRLFFSFLIAAMAVLTGCASADYAAYAKAHEAAQVERSKALAAIAASGSDTAKVAATMALSFGAQTTLQAPRDGWDRALQALGIAAPLAVQAYGINKQTQLGIVQSNNALAASQDANATMLGFGGLINSPVVVQQPDPVIVQQPAPIVVRPEVIQPAVVQPTVIQAPPAQ